MPATTPLPAQHLVLIAVLLQLTGCAGRARPSAPERAAQPAIELRFVGNRAYDGSTLRAGLSLQRAIRAGQRFDPFLVTTDQDRLRGFYLRRGYFDVEVETAIERTRRRTIVTFSIAEGPRARLARVDLIGVPDDPRVSAAQLRALIGIDDGEPFVYEIYEASKERLLAALQGAGYARAELEGVVTADRIRHEAVIRIELSPGPLAWFGEVTIVGARGAVAEAIRARLRFAPGDRYSPAALARSEEQLYEMGRFAVVRIEPDRDGDGAIVPITVRVSRAVRHELRLGGGLGLDPESVDVHGRFGYRVAAWPAPLTTTRLELRPALAVLRVDRELEPRLEAVAAIERLDLLVPLLRAEAEVALSYLTLEAFTSVGPRIRLMARYPVALGRLHVAAGWHLALLDFRNLDRAIDEPTARALGLDTRLYRLGTYEQALVADLRDDPIAPTRGLYGELRVEEGTGAAGGAFSFVRVTPELRGYLPLGGLVIATRIRVGAVVGDLPVTERYLSGGASNHRGFAERRLAPRVTRTLDGEEVSVVIGGGGLVELGAELRSPLVTIRGFELGGVMFLDGGDVAERLDQIDLGHLHWAAGLGLRLATVVGPVRADLGYRLNRAEGLGVVERLAFHLSLGHAF